MPEPRLWTWRRLVAVTAARALLVGLLGLAAWGALPAIIGWHPTTVSSGSMMPRLHVGDVAVSRPLGSQVPPLTSVLLFHDPDQPGHLRMHRFVRLDDAGLLVTRGDANASDDSTPVALGAVVGIGTLRVPWVALPIVWLREGRWVALGLVAAGLALALALAASGRDREFPEEDPPEPSAGPGPGDPHPEPEPDRPVPAPVPRVGPDPAPPSPYARPSRDRLRRAAALLGVGLLAVVLATPAEARFADTTTSTGSLAGAPYFTCADATAALAPAFWYRMDETSSTTTTATDSSGNGRTGVYGSSGKTSTTSRACDRDSGRAMTFNGSSGYLSSRAVTGGMPSVFTLSIWFRTTTRSGGKLIGFGSAQTGASGNYDRHVYLADNGRLYFGVYANAVRTVSSVAAYNDGDWHLATASLSSAGMRLYVDGALVASDATTTTAEPGSTAYLRVAYDNLDNWDATPTSRYFAGTLDDAAYFPSALTAAQVRTLYGSGTS